MITLYQFVISHYCEKVRWALDYKELPYRTVNYIPGPHALQVRLFAPATSVPVIQDGKNIVQDSSIILDYLDRVYPLKPLSPSSEKERQEVIEWEKFCDREIGLHLRRFLYHTLLEDKKTVVRLFVQDGPFYAPFFYALFFPVIRRVMIKMMNINEKTAKTSEERLVRGIEKINQRVKNNRYLVGDRLTRADITAASLLAPICMPPEHVLKWPPILPEVAKIFLEAHGHEPFYQWVRNLYATERF